VTCHSTAMKLADVKPLYIHSLWAYKKQVRIARILFFTFAFQGMVRSKPPHGACQLYKKKTIILMYLWFRHLRISKEFMLTARKPRWCVPMDAYLRRRLTHGHMPASMTHSAAHYVTVSRCSCLIDAVRDKTVEERSSNTSAIIGIALWSMSVNISAWNVIIYH